MMWYQRIGRLYRAMMAGKENFVWIWKATWKTAPVLECHASIPPLRNATKSNCQCNWLHTCAEISFWHIDRQNVHCIQACIPTACIAVLWAAWVVLNQHYRTSSQSSSELLKQLHWLPIEWRIRFKLATLTYLSNLLQHHKTTRSMCSSSSHYLSVPHHNLKFGSRAFRSSTPRVWNLLPVSIRELQSLPTFRRQLKTFYFQSSYPFQLSILPTISSSMCPDSS